MKFCKRPWEHLYIMPDGETRSCGWLKRGNSLGNLATSNLKEVWNSDYANAVRDSIIDGSYKYCNEISCPFLGNDSLPDLTPEEFSAEIEKRKGSFPTDWNLAYDAVCNHACPTCRHEIYKPDENYKERMENIEKHIAPYLHNAWLISGSGSGDLFSSKRMLEFFSKIHPNDKNCIIKIETNGVLVEREWDKVKHLEKFRMSVVVTPNSFERETYKNLSGELDNLDKTLSGLKFLAKLRKENRIKEFKITMVVQNNNFREIPNFIQKSLDEFNPDLIQFRPVMKWFKITKEDYLRKNVLNPLHPEHEEFLEVMRNPICSHPKVFHWSGTNFKREAIPMDELL